jgi:hypothetical protein
VNVRNICLSFGGAAVRKNVVYLPCTDGVRAVSIGPKGGVHVLWHTASSINGSPVVGGKQVWVMDTAAGVLHALGQYHGIRHAAVHVGRANRFETPALSGRRILVGTLTGLTVVRF